MHPTPRQQETLRTSIWIVRGMMYLVYAFLAFTELMLLQGFVLKLLGANPEAGYAQWAYRSLERVMDPFRGIFTAVEIDGNAILDGSILFAMVVYGVVVLVIHLFLDWLTYRLSVPLPHQTPQPDQSLRPPATQSTPRSNTPATERPARAEHDPRPIDLTEHRS